jgi:thioredoxin 2
MASEVVACPSCGAKNRLPTAAAGVPVCGKCHVNLPWLVNATDADFAKAIETKELVLVDMWAPWCGPCHMIAPILEQLAADYAGKLKVVKVNVDENQRTAQTYRAMSIPMMVFIADGETVETVIGAQPEHVMRRKVDEHLTAMK